VRGFSFQLSTGTDVTIIIPDIKSCTAYDLNCYITLTTAYTTELDEPYTLNILKSSVAIVAKDSVSKDYAEKLSTGVTPDPNLKADFNNLVEICTDTTWTFTFDLLVVTSTIPLIPAPGGLPITASSGTKL
jgi:hypothetical protein